MRAGVFICREGCSIEAGLTPDTEYRIRFLPQEKIATARTLAIGDEGCYPEITCRTDGEGVLCFSARLEKEQIYTFRLLSADGTRLNDSKVFAAKKDLWERDPLRGNTHCHVCFSVDGHEDPVIAASLYRKAGFDCLAVTDHHKADGSVYAVDRLKNYSTGLAVYYGEEVHVPNAYLHIINIGGLMPGRIGLDRYYHEHGAEVNAVVEKTAASVAGIL